MKIYFLFTGSIPSGHAYSNRITSLAKGLSMLGNEVTIINSFPGKSENDLLAKPFKKYEVEHYFYINLSGFRIKPRLIILQFASRLFGLINSAIYVLIHKKPDHLILCISDLDYVLTFYMLSRVKGFKLLREKNEYPDFFQFPEKYKNKLLIAKTARYRLFDGMILMTYVLKNYFVKVGYLGKIVIIPMTVDNDRFVGIEKQHDADYIVSILTKDSDKDGLNELVDAYKKLIDKMPGLTTKLRLIGDYKDILNENEIEEKLYRKGLIERVIFTGRIPRSEIPQALKNSKLFVLIRQHNKQCEGGFPTKLGEYLSSGNPVILTRLGEIDLYLQNNVHAFLYNPNNSDELPDKMFDALTNIPLAKKIGKNGFKLATEIFDYRIQSRKLNEFLKDLQTV
jgi:glycosyltransferase involved in cell wall biosynthesis